MHDKDVVAEAVHRAVCQSYRTDGFRHCFQYSAAGTYLLYYLTGKQYVPQGGTLKVKAEIDGNGCFAYDPRCWPTMEDALNAGEYHVWLAYPGPPVEIVDFSARHYKRLGDNPDILEDDTIRWTRPDPPNYVWATEKLPEWLSLTPNEYITNCFMRSCVEYVDEIKRLGKLAVQLYKRLTDSCTDHRKQARDKKKAERRRKKLNRR